MRSAESLEALGVGVGAEQVHAAVVALVGLQAFKDLLRVVQHGHRRIEREIGARFDACVMPAPPLRVADDRHVIGEHPAEARLDQLGRAVLIGHRIRRRLNLEFQAHGLASCRNGRRPGGRRNRHGTLPVGAGCAPLFGFPDLAPARPCGRLPHPHVIRTCFCAVAKSSMFAEMPLDNRTVVQFAGLGRHRWLSQAAADAAISETT